LVKKFVEGRHGCIVDIFRTASHEIEAKRYLVRLVTFGRIFVIALEHLSHHNFCQTVLVHATRPLMDEDIIENL
jgi:hypothetical protein